MSNIRIDIASEFKDKGFKAAEKRTTSLNRKFDNLARTAKRTFIAIAGVEALKRSVVAFAEEDRAANKLAASLRNLGLAYNTKAVEDYLEASEKATAISKDELSPAIAGLLSTTLSAEKSMNLLNLAMDVSTSTGRDLTSVTVALSRAYNGNFASLGKLQTAFTTAELEAMGFEKSVAALNEQFGGAAENNANTYAGKIDKLKIAFGDLAEEIGAGLIAFLESLGSGDYDNGLQKLVNFGQAIGDVFRRAGTTIEYTKALLSTGFRIDAAEQLKLDELRAQLANPRGGNFSVSRGNINDYKQQLALQKKIEADRKKAAALAAKSEREKLKREKEALQLKRAGTIFDMENIQIVAALQGQIDGEQRLRLVALLALNNDMAEAAEKASTAVLAINAPALASLGVIMKAGDSITDVIAKLINAQAKTALVDLGIKNLPKAKNPFEDWDTILSKIIFNLDVIANKIKNMPSVTAGGTVVSGNNGGNNGNNGGNNAANNGGNIFVPNPFNPVSPTISTNTIADQIATLTSMRLTTDTGTGINFLLKEHIDTLTNALTTTSMNALGDEQARLRAMGFFDTPGISAGSPFDPARFRARENGDTLITVNVAGNVVSAEDLAEVITDIQYEYQRSGKSTQFSSISI